MTAERPKDEAFRAVLKKEMSSLNVPIEASTDDLGKALNQAIRKELYKGSTKTRGLTADIVRNGPIAVSAADNYLFFTVPVSMSLSYGMFETPAITLKLKFKAMRKFLSKLGTSFRLGRGTRGWAAGTGPTTSSANELIPTLTLTLLLCA